MPGKILTESLEIKALLEDSKTIAVVGLSPKADRDSYRVAKYMKEHGYRILPVRPAQNEILGEKTYNSLNDIVQSVDIINVFRQSDQIVPHAHEAIRIKPKAFWMQLGIENEDAAKLLTDAGIDVVMNRCIKVEHGKI